MNDLDRVKEFIRARFWTFLGLALALGGIGFFEALSGLWLGEKLTGLIIRDIIVKWLVFGALLGIIFYKGSFNTDNIEMMPNWKDCLLAILVFLLGAASYPFTTPLVESLGLETTVGSIEMIAGLPILFTVSAAITAALTEEFLYRAYPIESIEKMTDSPILAGITTFTAFMLFHIPFWGLGGTLQISINGALLTALYIWRRNYAANLLAHLLTDIYAFVIIPMFLMQHV